MSIFISTPYNFGAPLSDDKQKEQTDALAQMQLLIESGYEPKSATLQYADDGSTYRVFEMARAADETDLDPQTLITHAAPYSRA